MKQKNILLPLAALLISTPLVSFAAGLQDVTLNIQIFFSDFLLPTLMTIAFAFFVINVIRFFIFEGDQEEGREKAKRLAIYGVAAFVFLVLFFGLINLLTESTGLEGKAPVISDYMDSNVRNF